MLKREDMVPGVRLIVKDVIKDGIPAMFGVGNKTMDALPVMKSSMLGAGGWRCRPGAELEVVNKVRRDGREGGNVLTVRIVETGDEGLVFWCCARLSCALK